jgi:hypothetical protein
MATDAEAKTCQWTNQATALAEFAEFTGKTQSASHIKPLHWYVACRLVLEGGFDPDDRATHRCSAMIPRSVRVGSAPFSADLRPKTWTSW